MKEPTRWKVEELNCCFDADMVQSPTGEYVYYSDYKQLHAECKEWREINIRLLMQQVELGNESIKLKREVERLKDLSENLMAQLNFDMDGWQPIETAPKDGTDVLCFCVEPEFAEEENPHKEYRVCFYGQLMPDYSCWMSHYGYEQRPTHWMPLPKPPAL